MPQYFFTKEIKTRRFNALPGMVVPTKYSSKKSIGFLRRAYGEDIVRVIDYSNTADFASLIAGGGPATEQFEKMRAAYEAQAETIRELRAENKKLTALLASRSKQ